MLIIDVSLNLPKARSVWVACLLLLGCVADGFLDISSQSQPEMVKSCACISLLHPPMSRDHAETYNFIERKIMQWFNLLGVIKIAKGVTVKQSDVI